MGSRGLGMHSVSGLSLVPNPAPKINAVLIVLLFILFESLVTISGRQLRKPFAGADDGNVILLLFASKILNQLNGFGCGQFLGKLIK